MEAYPLVLKRQIKGKFEATPSSKVDHQAVWQYLFYMATATQVQKNLQAAMRDALRIQDRFVAEPLFARTGRGYLKSEGVSTLQKIKSNLRRKSAAKGK